MASREKPLQPGTYYIGIDNLGVTTISPRTFTIRTFAVGDGYSVPVSDLSAIGAEAAIDIATPRMPGVYKISIPPLTKAWALSLTPTLGDFTLRVRYGFIPDPVNDTSYPDAKGGIHIQKSGDQRFSLLPKPGNMYLQEGDYYVMAVSEGQNSVIGTSIMGTGQALGTIRNEGPIGVSSLGTVTDEGLSQPVVLAAAEVKVFSVEVPAGINNLQFPTQGSQRGGQHRRPAWNADPRARNGRILRRFRRRDRRLPFQGSLHHQHGESGCRNLHHRRARRGPCPRTMPRPQRRSQSMSSSPTCSTSPGS